MRNRSEEFVFNICKDTFLSLWSYANPQGKKEKELCDILVVCESNIIIFSVKEIKLTESSEITTDWERWNRRAVEESSKQIYGAERWIKSAPYVIRSDGKRGLPLPEAKDQIIYRVAVALGGENKVPMFYGDLGKGFIHVFDETSFILILQELDTISDFIDYLSAKEELYTSGAKTPLLAGEENLLALYLNGGRKFPTNFDSLLIDNNMWDSFVSSSSYRNKEKADTDSYVWDRLIEQFCKDALNNNLEFGTLNQTERALRILAKENRFSRRILGKAFKNFLESSKKVESRMVKSPSGIVYVFLALPHGEDRKFRIASLGNRCFVARGMNKESDTIVGIATEQYEKGKGFSLDLYCLHLPVWKKKHQDSFEAMQKDLKYFRRPAKTKISEDEYPNNNEGKND